MYLRTEFFKSAKEGFTLLEVIIAMAIMVLAFSSILAVEGGSIAASARAKQMNIVGMLAKNRMVQTEFEIEGKKFDEVRKEESGKFEEPYEDYRWTTTVAEVKFPTMKLPVAQGGDSGENDSAGMITRVMTRFLSKALREVTVTVLWNRGKGDQKFALSTYWVDLNYEFTLSE